MRKPNHPALAWLMTFVLALALCAMLVPAAGFAAVDDDSKMSLPPGSAGAGAVDQQSADAANPVSMSGDPQGLVLTGKRGGSFAYYAFDYDGGEQTATIGLQVDPEDGTVFGQGLVGFHVYGPQKGTTYATGGAQKGMVPNVVADLRGGDRGRYLVQVFNYDTSGRPFGMAVIGSGPGFHAIPPPVAAASESTPAEEAAATDAPELKGASKPVATATPKPKPTATPKDSYCRENPRTCGRPAPRPGL
jgi:hypothetical protein